MVEHNESKTRVTGPNFQVILGFDEHRRMVAMSSSLSGAPS
jgi:hypothetical protein